MPSMLLHALTQDPHSLDEDSTDSLASPLGLTDFLYPRKDPASVMEGHSILGEGQL